MALGPGSHAIRRGDEAARGVTGHVAAAEPSGVVGGTPTKAQSPTGITFPATVELVRVPPPEPDSTTIPLPEDDEFEGRVDRREVEVARARARDVTPPPASPVPLVELSIDGRRVHLHAVVPLRPRSATEVRLVARDEGAVHDHAVVAGQAAAPGGAVAADGGRGDVGDVEGPDPPPSPTFVVPVPAVVELFDTTLLEIRRPSPSSAIAPRFAVWRRCP